MADDVLTQLDDALDDAHESALCDALDGLLGRLARLSMALGDVAGEMGIPAHRLVDSAQTARFDDQTHTAAILADRARREGNGS